MQAIQTRYHGPTNTRPARITARAAAGSISISVHIIPANVNRHRFAAVALCAKLNWSASISNNLLQGSLPDEISEVFVFDHPTARE